MYPRRGTEDNGLRSSLPLSHDQPAIPGADAPAVLDKSLSNRRFKNADLVQRMFTTPSDDFQWFCFRFCEDSQRMGKKRFRQNNKSHQDRQVDEIDDETR